MAFGFARGFLSDFRYRLASGIGNAWEVISGHLATGPYRSPYVLGTQRG
jgi:hypothetical protein